MWVNLKTKGEKGSEGGIILIDEEYDGGCRITLEKTKKFYAITCGVYGAMVHTAFYNEENSIEMYNAMKQELQHFMDRDTSEEEEIEFYMQFTGKY